MRKIPQAKLLPLAPLLACFGLVPPAHANDRHFSYAYETAVLAPGAREFEIWTTWRTGRDRYFSRFDHRLEFEVGLVENLQTAFYLNFDATSAEDQFGARVSNIHYGGISSEWKYKLADPVADPVGFALYGEASAAPDEYELEAKLLLDERFGSMLLAFNLVGEIEWELEADETEREYVASPVLSVGYLLTPSASIGLEVRNHNEIVSGKWEHSALHAGPVASYSTETWWAAMTFLPQIADLKNGGVETEEHERFESRLLFGVHL